MLAKLIYRLKFLVLKIARVFHFISKKQYKIKRSTYRELINFDLSISENKIAQFINEIHSKNNKNQKKLLFITPDCSFTGAPLVLFKVAQIMQKRGYLVAFISIENGPLSSNITKEGFVFTQLNSISYIPDTLLKKLTSEFDFCMCNTILTHKEAVAMQKYLPTLFYIHEAKNLLDFEAYDPMINVSLPQIKNIICPSQYSAEFIKKYTSTKPIICPNAIDDCSSEIASKISSDIIKFAIVGLMSKRKGIDIICPAFANLNTNKAELHIIGGNSDFADEIKQTYANKTNIIWHGAINDSKQKNQLFNQMDVFVTPSRDDCCPLVVLEAAMLGKPLIISENVGCRYLVEEENNGFIVKTEDINDLSQKMQYFINNKDKIPAMGQKSREKFLATSTMEVFEKDISQAIEVML